MGRRRWSIPVEASGEARCCKPADCNQRAMTASPASLAGPAALWRDPAPAWSYRAVAAALLCCIWPPMWRCDRLWGANFQDLFWQTSQQTQTLEFKFENRHNKISPEKKSIRNTYEKERIGIQRRTWKWEWKDGIQKSAKRGIPVNGVIEERRMQRAREWIIEIYAVKWGLAMADCDSDLKVVENTKTKPLNGGEALLLMFCWCCCCVSEENGMVAEKEREIEARKKE